MSGLTNEELDRCHYLVQIPTDPDYPSLNIAAAVQVIAYELRIAADSVEQPDERAIDYASMTQMEQFYTHLEHTLVELEFLDPENPRPLTEEVLAALETVLERSPRHPLAIHLYIHAVEASSNPERAEGPADTLAGLVPGAGHLVHMPAHIYWRVGRYHDASEANVKAAAVDEAYPRARDVHDAVTGDPGAGVDAQDA